MVVSGVSEKLLPGHKLYVGSDDHEAGITPTAPVPPSPPLPAPQFDFYRLALQYALSLCDTKTNSKDVCSGTTTKNLPTRWSIHGLWPMLNGDKKPTYKSGVKFDYNKIAGLHAQLGNDWYNAKTFDRVDKNWSSFWEHEWDAHGQSSNLELKDYFVLTLKLFKQVEAEFSKFQKNYLPGSEFKPEMLANQFPWKPWTVCNTRHDGKPQLLELRFELSPGGTFRPSKKTATTCPLPGSLVLLPDKY